jgi:hypothetical protein
LNTLRRAGSRKSSALPATPISGVADCSISGSAASIAAGP